MPKKITAYECEHGCGKFLKTLKVIENHEDSCLSNKANRTCKTCEHDYQLDGKFTCFLDVDKGREKIIRHCSRWTAKFDPNMATA